MSISKLFTICMLTTFCISAGTITNKLNAQDIVYFNAAELLMNMPEIKQIDTDIDAYRKQLSRQLEDMITKFEAKAKDAADKERQGLLSPRQLELLSEEIGEERTAIIQYENEVANKVAQRREERLSPLLNRIDQKIEELAKEHGYVYIFDSSTGIVIWADNKYDITDKLKVKLGL